MIVSASVLNLVGILAGLGTTISFVPQLIRVWRLRSARDISLTMFLIYSLGVFLWMLYGIFLRAAPMILFNGITLALALAILCLKVRFDRA